MTATASGMGACNILQGCDGAAAEEVQRGLYEIRLLREHSVRLVPLSSIYSFLHLIVIINMYLLLKKFLNLIKQST